MTSRVRVRFTQDHYEVLSESSSTTWPKGWKADFPPFRAKAYVDAGVAEYVTPPDAPAPPAPPAPPAQRKRGRR